ncbi:MAG TPA: lysylphosphatidylglycerol synthase domain-containing protein [Gaiellaceae bacterium]|nr:lysylphosphatidylglycerol synthase domain-containing protein [Gaiellaceae bacterium]
MQRIVQFATNPRVRRVFNLASGGLVLIVGLLVVRHFVANGWPIHHANPMLLALAAGLFLVSYGCKAFGWQRLFAADARPHVLTLAAAGGAAAVGGIALPGRVDELIRIAIVRKGHTISIASVALTLFVLGLIDAVALMPLASVAAALVSVSSLLRAGLGVVAFCGIGAAVVVVLLPRFVRVERLQRFRLCHWLARHATCPREATKATLFVGVSWTLRAVATFVLLQALGISASFALALAFLCAGAASAVLPVAPAGAATQAGAGAAILIASGVPASDAIAFSIAAQALVIASGAVFVLVFGGRLAHGRLRPALARARL